MGRTKGFRIAADVAQQAELKLQQHVIGALESYLPSALSNSRASSSIPLEPEPRSALPAPSIFRRPFDQHLNFYFRTQRVSDRTLRAKITEASYALLRWGILLDEFVMQDHRHRPSTSVSTSWQARLSLLMNQSTPFDVDKYWTNKSISPNVRCSSPPLLFDYVKSTHGEAKALDILKNSNYPAPFTIRANLLKIRSRDELIEVLRKKHKNIRLVQTETAPNGIIVKPTQREPGSVNVAPRIANMSIKEFANGLFEVQDEGSQLIAELVEVDGKKGPLHVFDYCAGTGGKSLAIAANMKNKGKIVLNDSNELKLKEARDRLSRAGVQNYEIVDASDSTVQQNILSTFKEKMDYVLVDAPCSGTGTLRRAPEIKWRFSKEFLEGNIAKQRSIFSNAVSLVSTNQSSKGKIVYATCSILRQENEDQVKHFLSKHKSLKLEKQMVCLPEPNGTGPDGFFAAVFSLKPT